MKNIIKRLVSNWGNFPKVEAHVLESSNSQDIHVFIAEHNNVIARGNGRCYGDASLSKDIISVLKLNKFLEFDAKSGQLTCEAGVLLADVLEFSIPQGYFLHVSPGTKFITIGGAIAADVHGKNHHQDGTFSEWLVDFDLIVEDGSIKKCSRTQNQPLFWSTIGGMGLTGVIIKATFALKKIESPYIYQEQIKAKDLNEIFDLFEQSEKWPYSVAWIDCLQTGSGIGRSIMMRGRHAASAELSFKLQDKLGKITKARSLSLPTFFPSSMLNPLAVKAFNFLYYHKQFAKLKEGFVHYEQFFYPLDSLLHWNRMYGKAGFIQYQFVLPMAESRAGMESALKAIAASGQGSFLAVLKLFGKQNPLSYNSFPMRGYTLALDFRINNKVPLLIKTLDAIVKDHQGRIYRAKDAMSDPSLTNYLKNVESRVFNSLQNQRINDHETSTAN